LQTFLGYGIVLPMTVKNPIIKKLLPLYKEITLLGKIGGILGWDLNVNLPQKAAGFRAEESAYITEKITEKWLDPEFRTLVEKSFTQKDLSLEEKAIVRNLQFGSDYYYKVPKDIIIKKEKVTSEAFLLWKEARETNNFSLFEPYLSQIVSLDKEIAGYLGYEKNPYDALLNLYEPELTASECERLFSGVKKGLVPLIKSITKSKGYTDAIPFLTADKQFPIPDQEKMLKYLITKMGFDLTRGRVDVSPHPFTIELGPHDTRLTVAYTQSDFRMSVTSAMHEAGHGVYEQGISQEYTDTPLGGGVSLGIHEALSRFWENMVGRNPAYLRSVYPLFEAMYPTQLTGVSSTEFVRAFNLVKPSFIRINADEVTYSLHIVLRFEMENEIMNGKISVKDAPEAWREKSKALFGIAPEKDSDGVLQDVHWTYGNFGYFPAYALGNLYGAQFLQTMKKTVKFDKELEHGNLLPVKQWLDENIHTHGSLYFPSELVKKVTGKELDYAYFVDYLTEKYSVLYGL